MQQSSRLTAEQKRKGRAARGRQRAPRVGIRSGRDLQGTSDRLVEGRGHPRRRHACSRRAVSGEHGRDGLVGGGGASGVAATGREHRMGRAWPLGRDGGWGEVFRGKIRQRLRAAVDRGIQREEMAAGASHRRRGDAAAGRRHGSPGEIGRAHV